jgi:hypothetical protein
MNLNELTPSQFLGFGMAYTTVLFCLGSVLHYRSLHRIYSELIAMQYKINELVERNAQLRHMALEESDAVWKQLRNLLEVVKELRQIVVGRRS